MISVVVSFRNEEENLAELIRRVARVFELEGCEYECVFVNDSSTDGSLSILLEERGRNPRIKIVNMSRRFGVHPCVMAGLKASQGDAVIYMDADLQDPPELIPELIRAWKGGVEIVHTRRTNRLGESKIKMGITLWAYRMIDRFSEIKIPRNCGDFKLLSRRVVTELIQMNEYNPFMRGLTCWVGFKQGFVDYERLARFAGKTHFGLFGSGPIKEFERGIITFSDVPLRLALVLGVLTSVCSFLYLPVLVVGKFLGFNLPGWTAIMCAIIFLNGVLLVTIGVLGLYIGRIYHDVRGRPAYIIEEKIGFEE